MKDMFNMTVQDNILYSKRNIVDCIYTEARLEGIDVTYPDTNEIFNGRTVAGLSIDDTNKINNLKHAWEFILTTVDYPIDLRYIRQINSEIGKGLVFNVGNLRDNDVKIGGTTWKPELPDEEKINKFISEVTNNTSLSATERAINTLLYIMRSQIFYDGNKRTAQLLANKIMIEGGAGVISIPVDKQKEFVEMLIDYYETDNSKTIANFLYNNCIDGVSSFTIKIVTEQELEKLINSDIPFDKCIKDDKIAIRFKTECKDKVNAMFAKSKSKKL